MLSSNTSAISGDTTYIEDVFSTYLYTGNASTQTVTNNINLLSTGSVATTGTFLSSGLAGVAVSSDGSYAVVAANGVVKISTADEVSWQITDSAKTFKNCVFDSSGNLYVSAHSGTTVYIGKYNSSGTVQWFKSCSSSTPDDVLGMAITSDGNLFLGWGDTSGTAVSMKMSSTDGSITWQKLLTATSLKCQDVATDSSGNCYQLGYAGATRYPFIVKYDSSGNTTWQKQLATTDGTGGLFTYGIGVDSSANVFIACYAASGGTNKSWAVKLSSAGALSAQIGSTASNNATGLTVDSSGNVYYTSNNSVFKYDNSLTSQWMRNIYSSPSRNGVKVVGSNVYVSTGGGLMLKLKVDGTTYEGFSDQLSSRYYSSPVDTTYPSTSISVSTSTITFGNGSYTVANSSTANNVTYTTVAQTFPAISAGNGMVWGKTRSAIAASYIADTTRGLSYFLSASSTSSQSNATNGITSSGSTGFTVGASSQLNGASVTQVAWTFKEQPKFFDVVTYTGNGGTAQTISHSLGSSPGCIIIKNATGGSEDWAVWHRSFSSPTTQALFLNTTAAVGAPYSGQLWNGTAPTSTGFTVKTANAVNTSGTTYVAYLFAHDAGGFGLTGSDNVISCGSYTGNGSATGPTVTLGWEPQWVLIKGTGPTTTASNWMLFDNMRGIVTGGIDPVLYANLTNAEVSSLGYIDVSATGFQVTVNNTNVNTSGDTYIYIAIRRGPMKVPTDATKVFQPTTYTGTVTNTNIGTMGPIDAFILGSRDGYGPNYTQFLFDRLRGTYELGTAKTSAEVDFGSSALGFDTQSGWNTKTSTTSYLNGSGYNYVSWNFKRSPSFFDVVCYTGTGAIQNISHNLGVTPTLILTKTRTGVYDWLCYSETTGTSNTLYLNTTNASTAYTSISAVSSTTFTVPVGLTNTNGDKYVAYLFATCPGVSKVGSFTNTGSTINVECGFTSGARFVMCKRTSGVGSWWVYDSARGIIAGNDPYLALNLTSAEAAAGDDIDPYAGGFTLNGGIWPTGDYIFLAIA